MRVCTAGATGELDQHMQECVDAGGDKPYSDVAVRDDPIGLGVVTDRENSA